MSAKAALRTIRTPRDVDAWLASPTCASLLRFLESLSSAARGHPVDYTPSNPKAASDSPGSELHAAKPKPVRAVVLALEHVKQLIAENPPV